MCSVAVLNIRPGVGRNRVKYQAYFCAAVRHPTPKTMKTEGNNAWHFAFSENGLLNGIALFACLTIFNFILEDKFS